MQSLMQGVPATCAGLDLAPGPTRCIAGDRRHEANRVGGALDSSCHVIRRHDVLAL
jgi:hypothetical protein